MAGKAAHLNNAMAITPLAPREKTDWLYYDCMTKEEYIEEWKAFLAKPIPSELEYQEISPEKLVIEVFSISPIIYKDKMAREKFKQNQAAGIISITEEYKPLIDTLDSSGNSQHRIIFTPFVKILALGKQSEQSNPLNFKVGDIGKLSDAMGVQIENPVYLNHLAKNPHTKSIGITQTTPDPVRFIYPLLQDERSGLGRSIFNVNAFTSKYYGVIFKTFPSTVQEKITELDIAKWL